MSNDLSQLDELLESDVLDALGEEPSIHEINHIPEGYEEEESFDLPEPEELSDIDMLSLDEIESALDAQESDESSNITVSSSDLNNLTSILSDLLKNKTIEITIKVKD